VSIGRDRDAGAQARGLRALSVAMGVFLFCMGIGKIGWLSDPAPLVETLRKWHDGGPRASRWYIENLAVPGAPVFARVVPLAELSAGAALVCGFQVRLAAGLALVMILNFHFAAGVLFHFKYLTNGFGLPVLGGLMALALGGAALPLSLRWPGGRAQRAAS
jgi:uncharacterized membrane protein YphA (DoxX/SURF4 family)